MAIGKTDLLTYIKAAEIETTLTNEDAKKAIEYVLNGIKGALKAGHDINFIGFGSFNIRESAARNGRNPKTGESLKISARKRVTFKAGKEIKEAVNG